MQQFPVDRTCQFDLPNSVVEFWLTPCEDLAASYWSYWSCEADSPGYGNSDWIILPNKWRVHHRSSAGCIHQQLEKSWKRHGLFIGNAAWKYPRNGTVDPEKILIVPVNFWGTRTLFLHFQTKPCKHVEVCPTWGQLSLWNTMCGSQEDVNLWAFKWGVPKMGGYPNSRMVYNSQSPLKMDDVGVSPI